MHHGDLGHVSQVQALLDKPALDASTYASNDPINRIDRDGCLSSIAMYVIAAAAVASSTAAYVVYKDASRPKQDKRWSKNNPAPPESNVSWNASHAVSAHGMEKCNQRKPGPKGIKYKSWFDPAKYAGKHQEIAELAKECWRKKLVSGSDFTAVSGQKQYRAICDLGRFVGYRSSQSACALPDDERTTCVEVRVKKGKNGWVLSTVFPVRCDKKLPPNNDV